MHHSRPDPRATRAKYASALSVTYEGEAHSTVGIVDTMWDVTVVPANSPFNLDNKGHYGPPSWSNYVMWDRPEGVPVPDPEWDDDDRRLFDRGELRSTRARSSLKGTFLGSGWYRLEYKVRTVCSFPAYLGYAPEDPGQDVPPLDEHICVPKYEGTEPEPRGSFPCEDAPPG